MPKKRETQLLKQLCIYSIAKQMNYWCDDYAKNFLDQGNYLYVLGPFDVLTSDFIQDLIYALSELKLMKRYYLHLLFDKIQEYLDLSVCRTAANKDTIISLITVRCQRLKYLNLSTLNLVPGRVLLDLVSALPLLTVLNLKQTKCDDQVLTKIGNVCSNLKELNLSACPITDMGIMSLCVSFDPLAQKCAKLLKLDVTSTVVTVKGIQCALDNLPQIQFVIYPDICEALYRMFSTKDKQEGDKCDHGLKLRYLSIQQMKATLAPVTQSIEVSCNHCPNITEVHFLRGVNNAGVLALSVLKHIKILHLANCEEQLMTFEEGILPLLQASGKSMEELFLNEINQIDVGCVGVCCPNLKIFSCLIAGYDIAEFLSHSHPEMLSLNAKTFTELEEIRLLLHTEQTNFSESYIRMLMNNSPKLKSIQLAQVDAFTDQVLEQILNENPLHRLQKLKLESCMQITGEGIWKLIQAENNLKKLSMLHCFEITRADYYEVQKYCQRMNYAMDITWE